MLSTNSTKVNFLFKLLAIILKLLGSEDSIIRMVLFDLEAFVAGKLLKLVLACNSLLSVV